MFIKKAEHKKSDIKVLDRVSGEKIQTFYKRGVKNRSADMINVENAILSIDKVMDELFLESDYFQETIEEFYSKNYNKKSYQDRVQLFANLALCCSQVFGENIIKDGVKVISDSVNGESIFISDGELYMDKALFEHENVGIINLSNFVFEFRKHIIILLTNGAMAMEIMPSDLTGLARIYYENVAESILEGSWRNFKTKDDKDYYNQPIIIDSTKKSIDYAFHYMKQLYKKYHKIDAEFSYLANNAMSFYDLLDILREKRKTIIKQNRENVKNYDVDLDNYERYLQVSASDLSVMSDDEFFALFNASYYMAINANHDGQLEKRLTSLCNELMKRAFTGLDTSNVEFPIYKFDYNQEDGVMTMIYHCDGEDSEGTVEDSSQILTQVVSDIAMIAKKYSLVRFNDEQEKQDWDDMNRWYSLKEGNFNQNDEKVFNDGLNIVLTKISELLGELQIKIDAAISKSDFYPHGPSMIKGDNREAIYDYYEFKNGLSKEEVRARLMKYVRDDLVKLESRGGR